MSSAASATSSSSAAKKVEWYHLDRVAIAKRICLDPAAVKLKTALNNNNNNNNNNYNSHIINSSSSSGSTANSKSGKLSGNSSGNNSSSSNGTTNSNNRSSSSTSSSSFDIVHLLYPPGGIKPAKEQSGNNHTTSASNRRVVSHSGGDSSSGKGILALRYNSINLNGSGSKTKSVTNYVTSVAGSRQFAALQQKRRRKAQRLAASGSTVTAAGQISQEKHQTQKKVHEGPQQQQHQKLQRSTFLDEHGLIVHGGVKNIGGSCGSSSRSSSSGVSSDFEELDGTSTTTSIAESDSNMKVAASSAGSRKNGNCQSSTSCSECEDDDDEGPPSAPLVAPSYVPLAKMCKNLNGSNGSTGSGTTAGNAGINGNISNNNNNLSNLSVLNSLVVGDGSVGNSGGASGKMGKSGRVATESSRIVNRKVAHLNGSSTNGTGVGGGGTKSVHNLMHQNHHHSASSAKIGNKMESNGSSTLTRGKHANGSISSMSSASSTVTDNDRDTDNSFSEFPADLDFMGVTDKGKRRTDRYDSSESSDSGVATLSPGTSDSPEPSSTCCDFSSEHLDVGNLISASRSSSASNTSSYPTSNSSSKSSSSSSASTCSGTSTACLAETQGDPPTGSSVSTTRIIEAKLPSSSSTGSEASSLTVNPRILETLCQWKGCTCTTEATHNILEHIQTSHVAPQMKTAGYVCLWDGCKVFNKRSSSLSWLERHVLSHSGNKPFKCIFPGCGLSFSSQTALERHVNSHIATNGTTNGTQGNSTVANKKIDASPAKTSRRKKIRFRKQRINIGQRVDYFDKRIMEVIKHWLASSVDQYAVNAHDCTFRGEIVARRVIANCERQVLVRWHPRFVLNDEWMPESKFTKIKLVPLRRIPSDKIRLLYPALFPPVRQGKATRKRKARSTRANMSISSPRSTSTHSEGSSSLTTLPPSPSNLSPSDIASLIDTSVSFLNSTISSRSTRSSSSSSSSASMCSSFSSSASTSSTSSSSSTQKSFQLKSKTSMRAMMMMDTSKELLKSDIDQDEEKCHKKFCGSLTCDCPSALEDDNEDDDDANDSSHWALQVLYEDMGMYSS